MENMTHSTIWKTLLEHKLELGKLHLRELFHHDPDRFSRFSCQHDGITLDYSKNRITHETMELLLQLCEELKLKYHISAMFSGEKINVTENRTVLHTALRNQSHEAVYVDGVDVMPMIKASLIKMQNIAEKVQQQKWLGFSGKPITDIVNIGIGGSDLGPKMVTHALHDYSSKYLRCHFVSNVDGTAIHRTLTQCNPETTLFIIASKTFTTIETLSNANAAKAWLLEHTDESNIEKHFVAVSTNREAVTAWGIAEANIFEMWDWVGGRYSLWSAIGLSIAIMIGMENFKQLLAGAHAMDQHFQTASFEQNLPVLFGLIGIWNHNFFHMPSNAILPYCEALSYFPAFLQQADMESNGKSVDIHGRMISEYQTGPVLWGAVGTDGQHSFHQLLHQGTAKVWCDFILPLKAPNAVGNQHDILAANCFAQSQALMSGKTKERALQELLDQGMDHDKASILATHKIIPGNKPSNTILFPELNPYYLGSLIALYEHKIFTQGILWQINSFDQWGVELGKQLAKGLLPEFDKDDVDANLDSSTAGLVNIYKSPEDTYWGKTAALAVQDKSLGHKDSLDFLHGDD